MSSTLALPAVRPGLRRRHVIAVLACHFTAAFAALGLPPYLPELLPELGDERARWAGVLYIVPTAATALSAPLWGRLADRYGRKRLLLRAQLGLVVAFLLAAQAETVSGLAGALALQGLLGGTFAATGAYLAAGLGGAALGRALAAAQASARAALVIAPTAAGLLATELDIRQMYALAALGPLFAAALTLTLPEPTRTAEPTGSAARTGSDGPAEPAAGPGATGPAAGPGTGTVPLRGFGIRLLCAAEAAFVLSTVITFPYLLPVVEVSWPAAGSALAGALFALPHLCYLIGAPVLIRTTRPRAVLSAGFTLVALGAAAHPAAVAWSSPVLLVAGRLLLGAGLTCGLIALAQLTARVAASQPPGRLFGTVEAWSKGGAVTAGLAASGLAQLAGPAAPALLGAVIALIAVPVISWSSR